VSYNTIAKIAQDGALRHRIMACIAQEDPAAHVSMWADAHMWRLAASPGWAAAWASAEAGGIPDPGRDEGVITDGMILAAAQAVLTA
jgi:hypothetical protein